MAACLVGVTTPATPSGALSAAGTPEEIAQATTNPSIVFITANLKYYLNTKETGLGIVGPYELSGTCTGFYVSSSGYVATAGHCVDISPGSHWANDAIQSAIQAELDAGELDEATANQLLSEGLGLWTLEGEAGGSDPDLTVTVETPVGVSGEQAASPKNARVVETVKFEDGDVALLKTEESNAPVLLLADDEDVAVGTDVLAAGYPASEREAIDPSVTATFKDGKINNKGTSGGLKIPVLEMSAALSPGMSGGPTVNLDGDAVGINSATLVDNNAFNFIAPVSLIKEQLGRNNVKNELGPADKAYRAGLKAYFAGDYTKAVAEFDKTLGLRPSNFYAQDFKKKANEKLAAAPPTTTAPAAKSDGGSGGGSTMLIVGIVVALVVIAGVVLLVVRSGKGKKGGEAVGAPAYGAAPPPGPGPAAASAASPAPPAGFGSAPAAAPPAAPAPAATPPPMTPAAPPTMGTAPTTPVAPVACGNCGGQIAPGVRFCSNCGQPA